MPRKKSEEIAENEVVETVGEEVVAEKPTRKKAKFEYKCVGNTKYEFPESGNIFDLMAQTPFRMTSGDVRTVTSGLKVRIPEGYVGFLVSAKPEAKSQVCVLNSPVLLPQSDTEFEVMVTLKMMGMGYKIFAMGDVIAKLVVFRLDPVPVAEAKK